MPNRILKESIRTSDSVNELSWFEEVLFYRLMVSCDDYGRFDGRIAIIKGTCFPLKNVTNKDIEKALDKLVAVGLVGHYEVEEKPYLQLSAWERHQTIRAKKSKYPSAEDGTMITHESNCKDMNSDVPEIQSNPNPNQNPNAGDARLDDAIAGFIEFRKKIKKPMTDRAVRLAVGKLRQMTSDVDEQVAIVEQSVMNGWQGLFPLKDGGKKQERNVVNEVDEWV